MLHELRSFENLGTPTYFFELLNSISKGSGSIWTQTDVEMLFHNRSIDGRTIFDGCFTLACKINVLIVNENEQVSINPKFCDYLHSDKQMCDRFIENLILSLKDDAVFLDIFSSKNMSYDIIYHSIQINNSAFHFKYFNFKQLLIDFDLLQIHPTPELKKFILNSRYKKLFDKIILPEIRKRKIGIEELKRGLEQQQMHGEEAEIFVLGYEKRRLCDKDGIDWVAEYSTAEGYDISSFENVDSKMNDRFIEVKSYINSPYFFWSRNEMEISRIKSESYYLYLVDRARMNNKDYHPLIINNPFHHILNNEKWVKTVEKYRVELTGN
jgi:hypothetical protein